MREFVFPMRAKRLAGLIAIAGIAMGLAGPAWARRGAPPASRGLDVLPVGAVEAAEIPAVEPDRLLAEDEESGGGPLRFALPHYESMTPWTHGTWEVLPDGAQVWRLRIVSPNATDLNFGINPYRLSEGMTLHIYSEDEQYYEGPYMAEDAAQGQLWTPMIPGSRGVIELYVPATASELPELNIIQINRGYRDFFDRAWEKQQWCENDVICPEGDPWRSEIRSAATYTLEGYWTCSGQMIADVPRSYRNFFLTAAHCGINSFNQASLVVYWKYESPVCGMLAGGPLTFNQSGCTFLASDSYDDFCLVELNSDPNPAYKVHHAGWDRSSTPPPSVVGIHHPNCEEKTISFDYHPPVSSTYLGYGPPGNHWRVTWDDGVTEGGSSGSGLWSTTTHAIIGQLHGGYSYCWAQNDSDFYGAVKDAWDGTSAQRRLKDWLDPANVNPTWIPGADSPAVLWYDAINTGGSWRYLSWFGAFDVVSAPWIYHEYHGWMYPLARGTGDIWFFTTDLGWLWTAQGLYPNVYSMMRGSWLYYLDGTSSPRWFYNWSTAQWEPYWTP